MNQFMTNPWLFLAVVIWVVCGIVAAFRKNNDALGVACVASIFLGLGYLLTHNH